jgi:hypothetical protein
MIQGDNMTTILEEFFDNLDGNGITESKEKSANAKVRNKPNPVFDAKSKDVSDDKDHFPLGNAAQARNALARANQYDSVPPWYNGTLKGLKIAVARAVKKEYPSIDVTKKATE